MTTADLEQRATILEDLPPEEYEAVVSSVYELYYTMFPDAPPPLHYANHPEPTQVVAAVQLAVEKGSPIPEDIRGYLLAQDTPEGVET